MNTNTDEMRKMIDADVQRLREVLSGQHGEDEKQRVIAEVLNTEVERQRRQASAGCMWSAEVSYGADGKQSLRVRSLP